MRQGVALMSRERRYCGKWAHKSSPLKAQICVIAEQDDPVHDEAACSYLQGTKEGAIKEAAPFTLCRICSSFDFMGGFTDRLAVCIIRLQQRMRS